MYRNKIIIALIAAFLVTGCANGKRSIKIVDSDQNGVPEQTVTNTDKVSQKTLRYQEKVTMAKALCSLQSDNHNEQRIVTRSSPVVIIDGKAVAMPESSQTVFYNPSIPPFNMTGCIQESIRWGGERLAMMVVRSAASLLTKGVLGYAAVKIADKVTDNAGVRIDNVAEGATVGVGTDTAPVAIDQSDNSDNRSDRAGDDSIYNTCAGEVVEGQCVLPAEANTPDSESETDEELCVAAGGEFIEDENRCSDGDGGTVEL